MPSPEGFEVTEPFLILENGVASEISFHSGYSQGIFLDQRDNRAEVRRLMAPGLRLLNTFAYTGAISVAAADLLTPSGWLLRSTNCRNLGLNEFQKQLRGAPPPDERPPLSHARRFHRRALSEIRMAQILTAAS